MREIVAALLIATTLGAGAVRAQQPAPPVAWLGGGIDVAQAVGEFADYVKNGVGLGGELVWRPDSSGPLGFRIAGAFLIYGSQTRRYPLVPGVFVDVTTNNTIGGLSLGPELVLGTGALQLHAHAGVGFSYFATTSEVQGSGNQQGFAQTTNFDDVTFAPEGGAGLLIRIARGRTPVFLDLGARFVNNGTVSYVTRDRITVQGNQLVVNPVESDANLVVYRLGVRIGLVGKSRDVGP